MATKVTQNLLTGGPELFNVKGADIASATTINLTTATGDVVDVTGTTTITAVTLAEGESRTVRFTGALTLTHGASLVLPGAANITTAAGDYAIFRGYASSVVRCVAYVKASGKAVAALVSADLPDGVVVQAVNTTTGAVATGTTVLPLDDTIPQNTEGDEYMTLAITPKATTNKLKIEVTAVLASSAGGTLAAALFQDSTANALAVASTRVDNTGSMYTISFTHWMAAGTVSATTFKVRCGNSAAGTVTLNGAAAARQYGGVCSSSITITEIKAA